MAVRQAAPSTSFNYKNAAGYKIRLKQPDKEINKLPKKVARWTAGDKKFQRTPYLSLQLLQLKLNFKHVMSKGNFTRLILLLSSDMINDGTLSFMFSSAGCSFLLLSRDNFHSIQNPARSFALTVTQKCRAKFHGIFQMKDISNLNRK